MANQKELIKYIFLKKTEKEPCKQRDIAPILYLAKNFGFPLKDLYFEFSELSDSGLFIPCFSNYLLEAFGKTAKSSEKEENGKYYYYYDFVNKNKEIKTLENKIENTEKVKTFLNFLNKIRDDKTLTGLTCKLYLLSQGKIAKKLKLV